MTSEIDVVRMPIMQKQAQQKLDECIKNPDFLYVSGSKLYGTSREGSDDDLRGFVVPPKEYLLGVYQFEQYEAIGCDTKIYSLKKFLGLLANGDPQSIECLFIPEDNIVHKNHIYDAILRNRSIFLSKTIYKRLCGFAWSEWKKAMCEKIELEKLPPQYDSLRCQIVDYCRTKNATKEDTDLMLEQFDKFREFKIVPSLSNLGAKRKKDYEKNGFCTSSCAHSVRLMGQLSELLSTEFITFPRHNNNFLRDIRNGLVTKEICQSAFDEAKSMAELAFNTTKLPDKADYEAIDKLYYDIICEKIK